jgi:hypothetical protein
VSPALPRTLPAFALVLASLVVSSPSSPASTASAGAPLLVAPVAARPVRPTVREYAVAAASPAHASVRSVPRPSRGFGVVGATWRGSAPAGLRIAVRTSTAGRWSSWTPLGIELADHAPDRRTAEAAAARAGTDPVVVGDVDLVQMRATSRRGGLPADLTLSVVDPGSSPADDDPVGSVGAVGAVGGTVSAASAAAAAVGRAPRPKIRTRAAWGANERLRTRRPTFGVVRAGFVHHTVNTNGYSRRDVPAIIRGIYAFHTQSRGWSDIGYNFLVDRFGRIWEGRFGGVARNVIGAHTLGYNHLAFAMSAIGNFQTARPPRRMLRAFGRLMAWKLGINGVAAGDLHQRLRGHVLRAISGHRDAGQTACPGIHLYKRIPTIRRIAIAFQRTGSPPAPTPPPAPPPTPTPPPPPPPDEPGGPGPG